MQIEAFAQGIDFSLPISRAKFEELNIDLFKKTLQPVAQVLKDAVRTTRSHDAVKGTDLRRRRQKDAPITHRVLIPQTPKRCM
jgi:hypothetical protein